MNASFDIRMPIQFRQFTGIVMGTLLMTLPLATILPEFVREAGGIIFAIWCTLVAFIQFQKRKKIGLISLGLKSITIHYKDQQFQLHKDALTGIVLYSVPSRYGGHDGMVIRMTVGGGTDLITLTASQLDLEGFAKSVQQNYGTTLVVRRISRSEWYTQIWRG